MRKFLVDLNPTDIDVLCEKLQHVRWPDKELVDDWSQGVPLSEVKNLCDYWLSHYDHYRIQRLLNQYPQFVTNINGLDVHFLHIRSPHSNALPMIMTHGWPGSVLEFIDVIGPLTCPTEFGAEEREAFHLVIPSLPGFGFSGKPSTPGWGVGRIANSWVELMASLGYTGYVAQGGDWGSGVAAMIGEIDSQACRAIHLNFAMAMPRELTQYDCTADEKESWHDYMDYLKAGAGYATVQQHTPQTLGYGLADSPSALAAWIYEKLYLWSDHRVENALVSDIDRILDLISLYWFTNSATSSARLYWESFSSMRSPVVSVETGITIFPKELLRPSRRWASDIYRNLRYWNKVEKGGHFAALEQPDIFVDEVRRCFSFLF